MRKAALAVLVLAFLPVLPPIAEHLQVVPAGAADRGQVPAGALWSVAAVLSFVAVVVASQPVPLRVSGDSSRRLG